MKTKQFYYPLPTRLIAQHPSEKRGEDRMMVLHRDTGMIEHRGVADIVEYLNEKDLLVVNDTKVFPARLLGTWSDSPGAVEVLMVSPLASGVEEGLEAKLDAPAAEEAVTWSILVGSGRPSREGQVAVFGPNKELEVRLVKKLEGGLWRADFICSRPLMQLLDEFGHTPVPPYVHREGTAEEEQADRARYQTIYAKEVGAVAAPTAGLHFTEAIFAALEAKGVRRAFVTLHVGPGTFKPVKAERVEEHKMDPETYVVSEETARAIAETRANGGRIVAVGSTSVRTLETVAALNDGKIVATHGSSTAFIYPPYAFRAVDAMLTNFHLPQSTLIMMVSALAGRERILEAYREAVRERYRFFSYGDCMLIL